MPNPALSVARTVLVAVLAEGTASNFLKLRAEMALGRKAQISRDLNVGVVRVSEQIFGALYFFAEDIPGQRDALVFSEQFGQVIRVDIQSRSEGLDG